MFSCIFYSKLKINPRCNIKSDLKNNIFTVPVALSEHKIKLKNGILSKSKKLFDKSADYSCYYGSKRSVSGPSIQNSNESEINVKQDKTKEDRKVKKPTVYVKEEHTNITQTDQQTVDEIRKILRHKWGVKLTKDVAPPQNDTVDSSLKVELIKKVEPESKILLGIVNKTDADLEGYSFVKRTKGHTFKMDKIAVLQAAEFNETTAMDSEYYVPSEIKQGEEANIWKSAAIKSTRRVLEERPTPEELQVAKSIFIRPEPPALKSDEKSPNFSR